MFTTEIQISNELKGLLENKVPNISVATLNKP